MAVITTPGGRRSGTWRLLSFVVAVGVVATACTPGHVDPTSTSATATPAPFDAWSGERPADQLVLQVDSSHPTLDYTLTFPPRYSIYADGTVYFLGALKTAGFLPILMTITSAQLTDAQLVHLSALIDEIGLPNVTDYHDCSRCDQVVDGTTTTAIYFDPDGGTHSYGMYELYPDTPDSKALSTLVTDLNNMTHAAIDRVDLPADRLRLHWRRHRTPNGGRDVLPWPLSIEPRDFVKDGDGVRCVFFTGDAALEVAEMLTAARSETIFTHEKRRYRLVGRVLLPGEEGCVPA